MDKEKGWKIALRVIWGVVALLIVCSLAIWAGMYFVNQNVYPEPGYEVESFDALREKLGDSFVLPGEYWMELGSDAIFQVRLKDRFHDDPSGYCMMCYFDESLQYGIYINCELLSENPGYTAEGQVPHVYKGVRIYSGGGGLMWCDLDGCQYSASVTGPNGYDATDARDILMEIIDQWAWRNEQA